MQGLEGIHAVGMEPERQRPDLAGQCQSDKEFKFPSVYVGKLLQFYVRV